MVLEIVTYVLRGTHGMLGRVYRLTGGGGGGGGGGGSSVVGRVDWLVMVWVEEEEEDDEDEEEEEDEEDEDEEEDGTPAVKYVFIGFTFFSAGAASCVQCEGAFVTATHVRSLSVASCAVLACSVRWMRLVHFKSYV